MYVPQRSQGVHCIIQRFFLFNVVAGIVEQFARTHDQRRLGLGNSRRQLGTVNLKKSVGVKTPPGAHIRKLCTGFHTFSRL